MKAILTLMLILLAGCRQVTQNRQDDQQSGDKKSLSYLALGDSYTIGQSVEESERWPVQLADSLRTLGVNIETPHIIARTGWTTDELALGITLQNPDTTFGLVSLLIGVNNQYRGRPVENFRLEFRGLLDGAIQFAGSKPSRVFVVSIPDWGVTPFASGRDRDQIAQEIDEYNQVKKEETEAKNVLFINITDISREALTDATLVADDDLHPSGEMYKRWVERMIPAMLEKLQD